MTSRTPGLALAGFLAAGCLALVAACGGGDSGKSDKTTAACKSDAALNAGFDKLFTKTPALQDDGAPPKSATPQIRKNYDKFVAEPLAQEKKDAPAEIAGDVKSAVKDVKRLRNGDVSVFMKAGFMNKVNRIDGYFFDKCDDQKTEVEGPDYAFDNLDDSYSPGYRRFKFQNTGKEVHEMVIIKRKAGVTQSFDELLKLPKGKVMSKVDFIDNISDVNPGKIGYTSSKLTPGDYIAVCFLPKGSQPGLEGKGKPHFELGMKKEFRVE